MTRRYRDEREPDSPAPLPFRPGPVSNGEFVPAAPTAHDREVARRIVAGADAAARRTGLDRRRFLQSASGMALTLGVLNVAACAGDDGATPSPSTSTDRLHHHRTADQHDGGPLRGPRSRGRRRL